MQTNVENLGQEAIYILFASFVVVLAVLGFLLWYGWYITKKRGSVSPYTKRPMMLGVDVPASIVSRIDAFMKDLPQPENPPFDMKKAAVCRETQRIFPDCVSRGEIISLNWSFLQKRYLGNWVSWGSLPADTQAMIKLCHKDISGFQTQVSSPSPNPQSIDMFFIEQKPGPLYVDVMKKVLLGWKIVPGTYFEVLVVKKPDFESIDETL